MFAEKERIALEYRSVCPFLPTCTHPGMDEPGSMRRTWERLNRKGHRGSAVLQESLWVVKATTYGTANTTQSTLNSLYLHGRPQLLTNGSACAACGRFMRWIHALYASGCVPPAAVITAFRGAHTLSLQWLPTVQRMNLHPVWYALQL